MGGTGAATGGVEVARGGGGDEVVGVAGQPLQLLGGGGETPETKQYFLF